MHFSDFVSNFFLFSSQAHAHRQCYRIPSGVSCLAFTQSTTRVPTPSLRSDSGCRPLSEPLQSNKTWVCSSPLAFPVPLWQPTNSSIQLCRSAPTYIYNWIHVEFQFVGDTSWAGHKNIPFHHSIAGTWSFFLFPSPLSFSSSESSRRLHSSFLSGRSTCAYCSCRWRRQSINSRLSSHFMPFPIHPNVSSRACFGSDFTRWGMEVGVAS